MFNKIRSLIKYFSRLTGYNVKINYKETVSKKYSNSMRMDWLLTYN